MSYKHYPNTGCMFVNLSKSENPKRPDYRGDVLINDKRMWVAAWIKHKDNGEQYLSLVFTHNDKYDVDEEAI